MVGLFITSLLAISLYFLFEAMRTMFWKNYVLPEEYSSAPQQNHARLRRLLGAKLLLLVAILASVAIWISHGTLSSRINPPATPPVVISALAFLLSNYFDRKIKSLKAASAESIGFRAAFRRLSNSLLQALFGAIAFIAFLLALTLHIPALALPAIISGLIVYLLRKKAASQLDRPD